MRGDVVSLISCHRAAPIEALKLNVSRQAVIKMRIRERLDPHRRMTR